MDIRLRAIETEDLEQLRDWRNSDWLRPYVREYRLLNMTNQHEWFHYICTSQDVAMFGITIYDELVGVCGLCNISWPNRTAEVSIYLTPEWQGQGIAHEVLKLLARKAFREYNLHRLWAEIYGNNQSSVKLFEDCGYKCEGKMVQHVYKDGRYHDSLLYGLVRNDE